jgi:hypothetical protein
MKTYEMLQENPVSSKIITSYYTTKMHESIDEDVFPEEFVEHMKSIVVTEQDLAKLVDANPIGLSEVFDQHEIYACLEMTFDKGKPKFRININGAIGEEVFDNRKSAESVMITECIKMLNTKAN